MAIKIEMTITFSKMVALIIVLFGGFLTWWTNNANIFVIACGCASAILANREYQQTR